MESARPNCQMPRVGMLLTATDVFNASAKERSERLIRERFELLRASDKIALDSLVVDRLSSPHAALAAADAFAEACVDLILIVNVGFPDGHVFLTVATHPHLARIPLAVVAEPEPESREWATNAWCGAIMNNHVARRIGRPIVTLPGPFDGQAFEDELDRLVRVAWAIKGLRRDFLCRFGDAPGGFHSATGDQLAFASILGTRVETVDLTAVMNAFHTRTVSGLLGTECFTDEDVAATARQVSEAAAVEVEPAMLDRAARLYHAYRAIIRANGYTSASFRCWPEQNEPYIGISPCVAMGLLLINRDITAAGCEGDWPTAVAQTMGTFLSGQPAVCLDWVNHTGASEIVQLGHCGMGLCGRMAKNRVPEAPPASVITHHPVLRQASKVNGPVHIGQFEFGVKTGICLTPGTNGVLKLLAFRGESNQVTDQGMLYSAADMRVPSFRRLNRLILDHGFPHHLAMAFGDVVDDLQMLCTFLDIEYVTPDGEEI